MELLWFYVAIVLAISDTIHTQIVWKIFNKFYLILGGIINNSVNAPWKTWIIHELMEAGFHFIFVSIVFLNLEIGILAAFIHFVIDVSHTLLISSHMNELEHRSLHFVIESLFFIAILWNYKNNFIGVY